MFSILMMLFMGAIAATTMLLVWKPTKKLTLVQLQRMQYVLEEQTSIDEQQSIYRVTVFNTKDNGTITYKEYIVDEHIVHIAIRNNNL